MINSSETFKQLFEFIHQGSSPFHLVNHSISYLEAAGFSPLDIREKWQLLQNHKYYCHTYDGQLFAFTLGTQTNLKKGLRMAFSHSDFPAFVVKPHGAYVNHQYLQLNVEVYGGPILNTFLDRPLSLAGKVALKNTQTLKPTIQYIDFKKPLLTIPNLAIHLNPKVNDGIALDRQLHLQPIIGMLNDQLNDEQFLLKILAKELNVSIEDILDFELFIYNTDKAEFIGINDDFISAPRLDNITSTFALIDSLTQVSDCDHINLIGIFHHEEIGSQTKQGAGSSMLSLIIEKIWASFGEDTLTCKEQLIDSLMLSVDVAHGLHPNYISSYDPHSHAILGQGLALKTDSNHSYVWDSEAIGEAINICQTNQIPYQRFVKRSTQRGGSTISADLGTQLPLKTIDLGVPLLAMHSSRELMGTNDQIHLNQFILQYFNA